MPNGNALRSICLALALTLAGCGGGGDVQSTVNTQTVGQELMDLQKARDSGALTQQEYERQRKAILERNSR